MGQRDVCTFRPALRAAYRTAISAAQILVYIYICYFIIAVQMSTAGIFWSRNLCLSVVMLLCTKFRVNRTNKSSRYSRKTIFIMAAVSHVEFAKLWHFDM